MSRRRKSRSRSRNREIRPGFGSSIKINYKVGFIFVCIAVCGVVLALWAYNVGTTLIDENKYESEKMISSAAEEYINTEIESMVSIAKTVYTNEALYEFLNTRYKDSVDYFDKYYDFSQSRFLVITENSSIKQFKIYTANSSVLNGGNIGKLDSVENEDWYQRFRELDRDMIIYCSNDQKNLSLIRKLDFKRVHTGEALIKIDFNPATLQTKFMDMYFDGKLYITSGGTVLYSNQKDRTLPPKEELSKYCEQSRNFYTCDISFHVCSAEKNILSVVWIPVAPFYLALIASSLLLVVLMITDLKNRILEVGHICADKKKASLDRNRIDFGKDEISTLYKDVNNTLIDLNRLTYEKNNFKTFINDYKIKTNDVILSALNYETRIKFGIETEGEVSEPVTLDEELLNLSRLLDQFKEREYFKYSLLSDTTSTVKNVIPYSLSAVALHVAQYNGTGSEVEIDVREHDECFSIRFYKKTEFSSADMLRLRAIFEPESAKSLPSYESEAEFNSYVRLSRFYLDNITLNINSKEELDFEFIITCKDNGGVD